ncbi:hypothetical protein K501DRAFT_229938 [Backusella circina FSU 941]|nr:hypothetical protein K501DRAFT_229938 [Backusella circina FSU 941]
MKELTIAYSLLLYAGKDESAWLEYIVFQAIQTRRNRLFSKIIQEIASGLYTDYKMCGVAFSLLFEMCKLVRLEKEDRVLLDATLFHHFLDLVEGTRGDDDESFNYDVIRLITVLNEQFLMSNQENVLIQVLQQRRADTFSANLIFMLNRSDDTVIQMLIVKSLYCIVTTPTLYEYFYTNDLYVLIDIILRVLCDLGDTKAQTLRDAYLRLLEPMLQNTQLRNTPYKQHDIHRTLMSLVNPSMQRKVHSTTKRIVTRILEEDGCMMVPPMMSTARNNSMQSLDSGPATPDGTTIQPQRPKEEVVMTVLEMDAVQL